TCGFVQTGPVLEKIGPGLQVAPGGALDETCSVTLFSTPSPAEEPTMWRPLTIRPVIGVAPIFVAVTCQVHGTPDAHEAEVALVTTRRPFSPPGLSGGSAGAAPAVPS